MESRALVGKKIPAIHCRLAAPSAGRRLVTRRSCPVECNYELRIKVKNLQKRAYASACAFQQNVEKSKDQEMKEQTWLYITTDIWSTVPSQKAAELL